LLTNTACPSASRTFGLLRSNVGCGAKPEAGDREHELPLSAETVIEPSASDRARAQARSPQRHHLRYID
jgi:hypothetical protein